MPFCANCGTSLAEAAQFCQHCGGQQTPSPIAIRPGAEARRCPFCKQGVESQASKCPHCGGEIGRPQDCIRCPRCSEMIVPMRMAATNEKGLGTDLAKVALGGGYFLSVTEESYSACPACRSPISYCSHCQVVTVSNLARKWVGLGRSKSGYQFKVSCSKCSGKVEGPSCFVATEVLGRSLDANLLQLYYIRDRHLSRSIMGRPLIRIYYRYGPRLARLCREHSWAHALLRRVVAAVVSLSRRNPTVS